MNAKLKFGIHQLAVKVHLGECSLNYIGRYNTKWCAGSDLITERPLLHTRRVSGGNGNGRGEPNATARYARELARVKCHAELIEPNFPERGRSVNEKMSS